jgi:hypothetical protein
MRQSGSFMFGIAACTVKQMFMVGCKKLCVCACLCACVCLCACACVCVRVCLCACVLLLQNT